MTHRRLNLFASAALVGAFLCWIPILRAQDSAPAPLTLQGLDALGTQATLHTDMTFNESMLKAAAPMIPEEDRPIIAKLRSITVHNFKYSAMGYDPAALEAVRAQFAGNGWSHMVTKQTHPPAQPAAATAGASVGIGPAEGAAPATTAHAKPFDPTRTDVWVRMDHSNFDGIVLVVANQRNVNVVVIDGMISPLDLLHLRGHFGIPRFGGDGFEDRQ
jgi:hypothetical protein